MVATYEQASDGKFPRAADLGTLGQEAADKLRIAWTQLQDGGATAAAKRVGEIDGYIDTLDYSGLETRVDPDLASEELAAAHQAKVRGAHMWRNLIALVPLLVTWLALGLASREYRNELTRVPADATKPFLLLWEQGFGHHDWWYPTFAKIALVDFVILLMVLWQTWRVHQRENTEDRSRTEVMHSLWSALDALKVAVDQSRPRPPATAEDWADAARHIIADAMKQTKLLSESSKQAIEEASSRLSGIQDQGREFIAQFSTEIQRTLVSVREQNEQFIQQTARESQATLQLLVEQQMEPLLNQLSAMMAEFGRHQETYRAGIADLAQGVSIIKGSAQELAESARAYNGIADSITKNLESIATSQEKFASTVISSAASMESAATAMNGTKDVLRTELRDGVSQMAANVTAASRDLAAVEESLADTSKALDSATKALARVATDLRAAVAVPARAHSFVGRLFRRLFGL